MEKALYVITHKEVDNIFPKDRQLMMVGAKDKEVIPQNYCTDYGENQPNISEKNKTYCELTGLYFFYKNNNTAEILGLEHYRRLFKRRKFYLFKFPFLRERDIKKILSNYDLIVPKRCKLKVNVYEHYCMDHIRDDIDKTVKIIQERYPEYQNALNETLNSNQTYFFNMFIAKANVIKEYCNWLFDILFAVEKEIDLSDRDNYQKRVFGFLSERLFTVWLNKNKQYKTYECNVDFIESNIPFVNVLKKIKHKLLRK